MKKHKIVWTDEKKEKAIEELTGFFEIHGNGECIMQSDDAVIDAPVVLSDIADDILKEDEGIIFDIDDE